MIVANDLRVKGVGVIEKELEDREEAYISSKGKPKYVVTTIERYESLRESEVDAAYYSYLQAKERGEVKTTTVEEHIKELKSAIQD